jgi:hypothetical protein
MLCLSTWLRSAARGVSTGVLYRSTGLGRTGPTENENVLCSIDTPVMPGVTDGVFSRQKDKSVPFLCYK